MGHVEGQLVLSRRACENSHLRTLWMAGGRLRTADDIHRRSIVIREIKLLGFDLRVVELVHVDSIGT